MNCKNHFFRSLDPYNYNKSVSSLNYFNRSDIIALPCGKCKACQFSRYSKWLNKLMLESETTFKNNGVVYFITITYDFEHYDYFDDLEKSLMHEVQKMWKRIRRYNKNLKIKYFVSTETGSTTGRLHHHIILFASYDFLTPNPGSYTTYKTARYFQSDKLTWENGFHSIAKIDNHEESAYCIKYVIKYLLKNPVNYSYSQGIGKERMEELTLSSDSNKYIYNGFIKNKPNKRSSLSFKEKIDLNKVIYDKYSKINNIYDFADNNEIIEL